LGRRKKCKINQYVYFWLIKEIGHMCILTKLYWTYSSNNVNLWPIPYNWAREFMLDCWPLAIEIMFILWIITSVSSGRKKKSFVVTNLESICWLVTYHGHSFSMRCTWKNQRNYQKVSCRGGPLSWRDLKLTKNGIDIYNKMMIHVHGTCNINFKLDMFFYLVNPTFN